VFDSSTSEIHDGSIVCDHNQLDTAVYDVQHQPKEGDREDVVNVNKNETTETDDAQQSLVEQSDSTGTSDTVARQAETTQPDEAMVTYNGTSENNDHIIDEVSETNETDKISQHDQDEEKPNPQAEEDAESTKLIHSCHSPTNLLDSDEKHESIRAYVDGYRDVELSGMKLATEQVGWKVLIAF